MMEDADPSPGPLSPPLDQHQAQSLPSHLPRPSMRRRSTLRGSSSLSLGNMSDVDDGDVGGGHDILETDPRWLPRSDSSARGRPRRRTTSPSDDNGNAAPFGASSTATTLLLSSSSSSSSSTMAYSPPQQQQEQDPEQQEQQQQLRRHQQSPNRRATMSAETNQSHRRASIQNILKNDRLSALEKRRSIQFLMDGRSQSAWRGRRITTDCVSNPYLNAEARSKMKGGEEEEAMGRMEGGRGGGRGEEGFARRRSNSFDDDDRAPDWMAAAAARAFERAAEARRPACPGGMSSPAARLHPDEEDHEDGADPVELMTAAAIDHATSLTQTEAFASSHPYKSDTTLVPGVAAQGPRDITRGTREQSRRAVEMAPKCTHYVRNCHIISPCCGATFACRICHEDCPVLPALLKRAGPSTTTASSTNKNDDDDGIAAATTTTTTAAGGGGDDGRKYQRMLRTSSMPTSNSNSMGASEHHKLPRFEIAEIVCRECFTRQSSKTNFCVNCSVRFGDYHCAICNLWMSNEERPYHCPDCGFCRVGGGENFRHCVDCGMCIDRQLFSEHNCKAGKYMRDCPVCQEDLFSSRDASHELPCGHAIHWHCFRELASHDSRCPVCKKTAETHERMKPTWDAMAMGIALQPIPPELCKVVTIMCNDCEDVQSNRAWHFLGVQCRQCESFNTVVDRITLMGQGAHEFLLRENTNAVDILGPYHGGGGGSGDRRTATRSRATPRRRTTDAILPNPNEEHPPPPFR